MHEAIEQLKQRSEQVRLHSDYNILMATFL